MNREIIIIGKPNAGKSTLFNRMLKRKIAITYGQKGTTRDLIKHDFKIGENTYTLIDSGGIGSSNDDTYQDIIKKNIFEKLEKVGLILILVSVSDFTDEDRDLINKLRKYEGRILLVVNKVDNDKLSQLSYNFLKLGLDCVFISAEHALGIEELYKKIESYFDTPDETEQELEQKDLEEGFRISILGEPNSGKSSLLNLLTKETTSLVSPIANTTRDTITASFVFDNKKYTICDTAGIRRKTKVKEDIEYYSVTRAIDSIKYSDVVILLIDVTLDLNRQDKRIAKLILDRNKPIIIVFNKMDLLERTKDIEEAIITRTRYVFPILSYAPICFISTQTGYGIKGLLKKCEIVYNQDHSRVSTSKVNQKIRQWIDQTPPTNYKGRQRLKIKYITQVSIAPPKFVIFVNNEEHFNENYIRFLKNNIQKELGFNSVPVILEIKETTNKKENNNKKGNEKDTNENNDLRHDDYLDGKRRFSQEDIDKNDSKHFDKYEEDFYEDDGEDYSDYGEIVIEDFGDNVKENQKDNLKKMIFKNHKKNDDWYINKNLNI